MADLDSSINFAIREKEPASPEFLNDVPEWKILIVDDEPAVHDVTCLTLKDYQFKHKPLAFLHAYSVQEAKRVLLNNKDVVIILLDIILETQTSGLDLIHWIRKKMGNTISQIIIRTGNPNDYADQNLIESYDINDYVVKTDVTSQRLRTLIAASIKTFIDKTELQTELNRRKQIERSLKENQIILKDVIANIGDILWEIDSDMTYVYISKKVETITGFPRSDFKTKQFSGTMTSETLKDTWPDIQEMIRRRKAFSNIEISRKTKAGDVQYFLTSGNPVFKEDGIFKGYRGADNDITQLKHAEFEKDKLIGQLRNAQRLEAMGTLAGGIAHDFNNILGAILGYAQLLQFELKDNQNCLSHTKQIVTGCNRAKNLIYQILDFSRQRESVTPDTITNPKQIIEETLKLLHASFPSSIKINADIDKNAGCIQADPSQIHQAVMNLCTNARQAIVDGIGQINIKLTETVFSSDGPVDLINSDLPLGEYICICVEDTGQGIESEHLDKIFNPYFTTKNRGDGTGLGLSVVHGIVTRFNGAITTKTKPGKGSIFKLFFPKYLKADKRKKAKEASLVKGEARVMFIDDEPMLVDLGKMMLEKLGYKVVAMKSPVTALRMIEKDPENFDLVVTDMTMPDMHGTKLAIEIKKVNNQIPIVLATGFSNLIQAKEATPHCIDAILPKPIAINTLARTIHQLLVK